jgi:hypothetical protein
MMVNQPCSFLNNKFRSDIPRNTPSEKLEKGLFIL